METSGGPSTQVPRLKRPPSPHIWKVLLAIGVVGRLAASSEESEAAARASEARARTEAEAASAAAAEVRRVDSVHLMGAVDSGPRLPPERALEVDRTIHVSLFTIPHDSVHRRVVGLQLDSTARVVRKAAKDASYAIAARAMLSLVEAPLTAAQERRRSQLSSQLSGLDRRLRLQAERREARARPQPQALQSAQPRGEVRPSRSRAPAGASARCRDGTLSYSTSRRGSCSGHGGVLEWF